MLDLYTMVRGEYSLAHGYHGCSVTANHGVEKQTRSLIELGNDVGITQVTTRAEIRDDSTAVKSLYNT